MRGYTKDQPAKRDWSVILEKVADYYHKSLLRCKEGLDCLRKLGLEDSGLIETYRIGYSDGELQKILPAQGELREQLKQAQILTGDNEFFQDCVVFPIRDEEDSIISLCGRHVAKDKEISLSLLPASIWNLPSAKGFGELHVAPSVIDALSLIRAGIPNVIGLVSRPVRDQEIRLLQRLGVSKLVLTAEKRVARRMEDLFTGFACSLKGFAKGWNANRLLVKHRPEKLGEQVRSMQETDLKPARKKPSAGAPDRLENGFAVSLGPRRYEIRAVEKNGSKLKMTLRTEHCGRLHVDTVDLYSAKARRSLCQDLARLYEQAPEVVEGDIARLVRLCEEHDPEQCRTQDGEGSAEAMSDDERREAEEFGKNPELLDLVVEDMEACGLIGERANKLLCYLAAVSRKMNDPLSVMILSSSGAGKSMLQDTTLMFCPPEDVVKLTSLSGKALFYKGRRSLKHKILALEEGTGAEEASYAIRNLISARELVIEATVKDLGTGKMTTMANRVEGPTAVFLTTTDPEGDPETKSRFFVISVDESREQTRAILEHQRKAQTLSGQVDNLKTEAIVRRHRNFQRLLRSYVVVNPYADKLQYADDRLQSRRDQLKYLNMIKAVAFLRQMNKEPRNLKKDGSNTLYLEATSEDLELAGELAEEILGPNFDDLNTVSRELLGQLERMVQASRMHLREQNAEYVPDPTEVRFTRRQIREFSGWSHSRIQRYLRQLVDMEYLLVVSGKNGCKYMYRLAQVQQVVAADKIKWGMEDTDEKHTN